MFKTQSTKSTNDMTMGSPLRAIIKFAIPLILGYLLQQMYLIIDAAIVGRWIGVGALAAVGASSSIMFLIMGLCEQQHPHRRGICRGHHLSFLHLLRKDSAPGEYASRGL